ncbi:DUF4244 domain-containing protein [Actinomadura sp. NPDC023710]|uniref:DUF4244 domain-containing protein n=1 Tax=Actinomadura sp. NPDC023710 TaxID=3158219 RepID=UPI0033C0A8DF
MNQIIPLYVTAQTFVQDRADGVQERAAGVIRELRERRDRGATGIEYAALILVAAAVIGVLIAVVNSTLKTQFTNAINNLFGGGNGGGGGQPTPKPTKKP